MATYRVLFYKMSPTSTNQASKQLLGQFDITSDSASGALVLAERQLDDLASADRIEVTCEPLPC